MNSPETEERIIDLAFIKENAKYYLLDTKEKSAVAVCWIDNKQKQRGFKFYQDNTGWQFNPFVFGAELMKKFLNESRYEITADYSVALLTASIEDLAPLIEQ